MYVDDFELNKNSRILTYYNGNTFNGKYADDTGNAYYIKFYSDGTVKTLYVGKFVGGEFDDDTGNAWDIAYWENEGYYVYNTGKFKNNNALNNSGDEFTLEQIKEKISQYEFGCELKWKE